MAILDELKAKANGAANKANNIQEAVSMMKLDDGAPGLKYVKDDPSDGGGVIEGDVNDNNASGQYSHAEGYQTTASGNWTHAEGCGTVASGENAHSEGAGTRATGGYSHAEGGGTLASGAQSHAEGASTQATGANSHAENLYTVASGACSHASGSDTIAQRKSQFVIGEWNVADTSGETTGDRGDYAFIIGNGITDNDRSNAFAIKWDGTLVFGNGTEITPAQFAALLQSIS